MDEIVEMLVSASVDGATVDAAGGVEERAELVDEFVNGIVDEALQEWVEPDTRTEAERFQDELLQSLGGLSEREANEAAARIQAIQRGKGTRRQMRTELMRSLVIDLADGVVRILEKTNRWLDTGHMEVWHGETDRPALATHCGPFFPSQRKPPTQNIPRTPADPTAEFASTYEGQGQAPCVTVRPTRTGRINSIG
eukprot:SAG31_NODE_808_length_11926_cov_13.255179_9_plen_196_part_00